MRSRFLRYSYFLGLGGWAGFRVDSRASGFRYIHDFHYFAGGARLFGFDSGGMLVRGGFPAFASSDTAAQLQHHVVFKRARVGLLVHDAQLRQHVQNEVRLYFELTSQLINANFTHTKRPKAHNLMLQDQALDLSLRTPP